MITKFFAKTIDNILFKKPAWIKDTTNHKIVWMDCISSNKLIRLLIKDYILSEEGIDYIIGKFDEMVTKNIELLSKDEQLLLAVYYRVILESTIKKCEDNEMYESCHNLKKFYDFFYK